MNIFAITQNLHCFISPATCYQTQSDTFCSISIILSSIFTKYFQKIGAYAISNIQSFIGLQPIKTRAQLDSSTVYLKQKFYEYHLLNNHKIFINYVMLFGPWLFALVFLAKPFTVLRHKTRYLPWRRRLFYSGVCHSHKMTRKSGEFRARYTKNALQYGSRMHRWNLAFYKKDKTKIHDTCFVYLQLCFSIHLRFKDGHN